ncbi:orotate phosphoribosyltransferase [bacterium]|nr:orotate phosphoribosyltransferase [bacterium]
MNKNEIENIFRECGALLTGHFLLSSGRHSDAYLEKFRIFERPRLHSKLIAELLERFDGINVDTVVGPALGGVIMASEAARQLNCRAVFLEKENNILTLRRGFILHPGEKTLILDDIMTTGGSVKEAIDIAQKAGTRIMGVGLLADRAGGSVDLGLPYKSLMKVDLPTWSASSCPLCRKNIELVKPGSRLQ